MLANAFPNDVTDPVEYMISIGVTREAAEWINAYVAINSCIFEKWGVDKIITNLIKSLHANSWFTYGDATDANKIGSRQGCKYGTTVFNAI